MNVKFVDMYRCHWNCDNGIEIYKPMFAYVRYFVKDFQDNISTNCDFKII